MKIFQCQHCSQPVFFENTYCESCGHSLGYLQSSLELTVLLSNGYSWKKYFDDGKEYQYCQNYQHGVCNWLVPVDTHQQFCDACRLNKTIPNLNEEKYQKAWQKLERAKHRLVYSLKRLNLPTRSKMDDPETGLAFDFLSNEHQHEGGGVKTGHLKGLITINAAEADSVHREYIRKQMGEPYRTLIGHFRHEIGHYYWEQLVLNSPSSLEQFRELFGDETTDYSSALQAHYNQGGPLDWSRQFVSEYASSHPWEDWAETWAHYLHLIDTLETAYAFGLSLAPNLINAPSMSMMANFDPYTEPDFDKILKACIPLTFAVNSLNRGMGQPDLYPFILVPAVVQKLRFIHNLLLQRE